MIYSQRTILRLRFVGVFFSILLNRAVSQNKNPEELKFPKVRVVNGEFLK